MSTTEPTTSSTFTATPTTNVVNNSPGAQLGENDFLTLLVAQLKDQDPTNPTDSSQFMSQLAQFSSLEQEMSTNQSVSGLATTTAVNQAVGLIGRNVTYTKSDGTSASGDVDSIAIANGGATVDIGGTSVELGAITNVGESGDGSTGSGTTGSGTTGSGTTDTGTTGTGSGQSSSTTTN